jgi:hypothetical protein
MTNTADPHVYAAGYACGRRGGTTDRGFATSNPYGTNGVHWAAWGKGFGAGARDAGYLVAADRAGSYIIGQLPLAGG